MRLSNGRNAKAEKKKKKKKNASVSIIVERKTFSSLLVFLSTDIFKGFLFSFYNHQQRFIQSIDRQTKKKGGKRKQYLNECNAVDDAFVDVEKDVIGAFDGDPLCAETKLSRKKKKKSLQVTYIVTTSMMGR